MKIDIEAPLVTKLLEVLRIPSVSTGEPNPEGLEAAAEWFAAQVREVGGDCELLRDGGNPLVLGDLRARDADAPTVLIYGHYDVQSIGDRDLWNTDPFDPVIRDGRIYARGASDDKGNFWPLLHVACEMGRSGELPVNIRVCVEGEEEAGSATVMRWFSDDRRGAHCCIVFDSGSLDPDTPAITVGTRGVIGCMVTVTVADSDMHSGLFGGSVFNAIHELTRVLQPVLPKGDGTLRDELREGIEPITPQERESWDGLPPGDLVLEFSGGRPLTPRSGSRYYEQNGGEPSLDVNMIRSGEPRTIVPARARAALTMRLAPGQDPQLMQRRIEGLLRQAAPDPVDLELAWDKAAAAASFDPASAPLRLAREAFEAANGKPPVLIRLGGSIPVLESIAARGIQTIVSGFATPADSIHAPNESYALESLEAGARTARELYRRLAELPR